MTKPARPYNQITLHHSTVYRYLRQDKSNGGTLWQHLRICSKPACAGMMVHNTD